MSTPNRDRYYGFKNAIIYEQGYGDGQNHICKRLLAFLKNDSKRLRLFTDATPYNFQSCLSAIELRERNREIHNLYAICGQK